MTIESARYVSEKMVLVVTDGQERFVPMNPANRDYHDLQEWVKQGGVVEPYVEPEKEDTPPSVEDRIAALEAALIEKAVVTEQEIEAKKPADTKDGIQERK